MRYLNYFNQILNYSFVPISRPIILEKIVLTFDMEEEHKLNEEKVDEEEVDYTKLTNNLFFRIYDDQDSLLFD